MGAEYGKMKGAQFKFKMEIFEIKTLPKVEETKAAAPTFEEAKKIILNKI
jgi:hypothetical protein